MSIHIYMHVPSSIIIIAKSWKQAKQSHTVSRMDEVCSCAEIVYSSAVNKLLLHAAVQTKPATRVGMYCVIPVIRSFVLCCFALLFL